MLSLPAQHGYLLRSVPVVAFVDSISLLISVLYAYVSLHIIPLKAVALNLEDRFEHPNQEENYRHVLRKGQGVRWLMFVFGVALPTIKLVSMKGLFWKKACGLSWVVSWLVIELLSFVASKPSSDLSSSFSSPANDRAATTQPSTRIFFMQTAIKRLHSEFLAGAVSIQFWISLSILRHLLLPHLGVPESVTVAVAAFMIICFFPSALLPSMSARRPGSVKTGFDRIPHSDWISNWMSFTSTVLLVSGSLQ